jgi:hypothetical protein
MNYDQYWQNLPGGARPQAFDSGKGLELIPAERIELVLGLPPYEELRGPNGNANGFGDWPFLLMKYRILSANEQQGELCCDRVPARERTDRGGAVRHQRLRDHPNDRRGHWLWKLRHPDDFERISPTSRVSKIGDAAIWNLALQSHVGEAFWPGVEMNYTYFPNGPRAGNKQIAITPNLIVGTIPIYERLGINVGLGYGVAVRPRVPTFDRNWMLSVRLSF